MGLLHRDEPPPDRLGKYWEAQVVRFAAGQGLSAHVRWLGLSRLRWSGGGLDFVSPGFCRD